LTGLAYVAADSSTGDATFAIAGSAKWSFDAPIHRGGIQVIDERVTGWGAPTGTATRTTFATDSVTTEQLAERVKALIDDLTAHGLIGS
jgi:hypothetical protein